MGMSLARAFTTDRGLEENGKWFKDVLGDKSNVDLCIRRMSSETVVKLQQELLQQNRYKMVEGKLPEDVDRAVLIELLSRAVIVDWAGVEDTAGNEIPFSTDAAAEYLTKLRDFRILVVGLASNMDNYRKSVEDEIVKN